MAYPTHSVTYPSDLTPALNGKLPDYELVAVYFEGRGTGRLHHQTARAWAALTHDCLVETGVVLTVTSLADAYRTYSQQQTAFLQRYQTTYIAGTSTKYWNGQTWYLKKGYAQAASPGTSNHGLGLALDVAEWNGAVKSISGSAAFGWLLTYAAEYGFSWEVQSEPWHIHLWCGDDAQPSTLAFEAGQPGPTPEPVPEPVPTPVPVPTSYEPWPHTAKAVIKQGSTGETVKYFQSVLKDKLGYAIATDGQFGKQTTDFAVWFQATHGLVADGIVGKNTWAAIDGYALA